MSKPCIFCQIAANEAPHALVYEDAECSAFMDIHPLGRGHVLVIPKQHAVQITELEGTFQDRLFQVARRVLKAQRQLGWGLQGTHILLNDGKAANQTVPHAHIHVIPRESRDNLKSMGRLLLHVTGLFGPRQKPAVLQQQAEALRHEIDRFRE
ncbi:HIT family protein [Marinobacter sp. NFXS9]|uniref:HIT family protein n=1 Tax=Marinobacter sp. NFXS9 TaxID=2818433 RepID=UPI0032DE6E3B